MKETKKYRSIRDCVVLAVGFIAFMAMRSDSLAYDTYSTNKLSNSSTNHCRACHGDFRAAISTKVPPTVFPGGNIHEMHRNSAYMGTDCDLCHQDSGRYPVIIGLSTGPAGNNSGIGCTGCHVAEGLRKHHLVRGVTVCLDCHPNDSAPPPETTKPPYYGLTGFTKANNPGNTVLATNVNENWSAGDFLGLDNDGNGLYDLADYAVGPFRLLSATLEGNNVRVTFLTAGGRTNRVQAAASLTTAFTNVSAALEIPGVGLVTNSYLDVGGATSPLRFYRLSAQVP